MAESSMLSTPSLLAFALVLCGVVENVRGHSWLVCTDYTEKGGSTWKPEKCRGFPRAGHRKASKHSVFGHDSGFDFIPSETRACQFRRDDMREYTREHPMAVYYPGQQVILVHPMKNHGADVGCTNIHIPDTGNWILRSERNQYRDPTLSEFRRNVVFDLGRSRTGKDFNGDFSLSSVYPKPGYQNAPRFCENTDKSMATFVMNVPKNLIPGRYTFTWLWAFNSLTNLYSSCFEVDIVRSKSERDARLAQNGFTDTTEPCGGMTSNPDIKGNSNRGCTPLSYEYKYAGTSSGTQATTPPYWRQTQSTTPFYWRQTQSTTPFYWRQTQSTKPYYRRPDPTTTPKPFVPSTTTSFPWWNRPKPTTTQEPTTTTTTPEYQYYGKEYEYEDNSDEYDGYYDQYDGDDEENQSNDRGVSSVDSDISLDVTLLQFSGEIKLPAPRSTVLRRYYAVDFMCDVLEANFWNGNVVNHDQLSAPNSPRRHYEVLQEGDSQLQNLHLYYHVIHKAPCDVKRFPPSAKLIREEYQNL